MRIGMWTLLIMHLVACGDNFAGVQRTDTIEAYEQFVTDHPSSPYVMASNARLEVLYLEAAKKAKTLEAYDRYLERFPDGDLQSRALTERESFLYDWSRLENTGESWAKFLDEYPRADKKRRRTAKRMVNVHAYREHLGLTDTTIAEVNLAEDPAGPLDGWSFTLDVTNNGSSTIEALWLTIEYLDETGKRLDHREWPVVAPEWPTPIEEEHKVPMAPGQTRPWSWTTGSLPENWANDVRVYPSRITRSEP